MNKKQVNAFLRVVYKGNDRPAITSVLIDKVQGRTCIVGTNGAMLALVFIDGLDDYVGKQISRIDLEAKAKSMTTRVSDALDAMAVIDLVRVGRKVETNFPPYMDILTPYLVNKPVGQAQMKFNAEFFKTIQDIDGGASLIVDLYGEIKPMIFKSERGIYVVMPMTLKEPDSL
ncbi:MAG: hypothetical protein Q4A74_00165 [Cardiobacteriaceae bacterium]|nr:hypothetical protein [Cardiobacteriaceae bacterium]